MVHLLFCSAIWVHHNNSPIIHLALHGQGCEKACLLHEVTTYKLGLHEILHPPLGSHLLSSSSFSPLWVSVLAYFLCREQVSRGGWHHGHQEKECVYYSSLATLITGFFFQAVIEARWNYRVGQKVHLSFFHKMLLKTQMNFFVNSIHDFYWTMTK